MDKSKQILLISILPVLFTLVFILYVLMPAFNDRNSLKSKLETKQIELETTKEKIKKVEQDKKLIAEVEKLQKQLSDFDINVPNRHELEILLIDLEKFANASEINIVSLDVNTEREVKIIDPVEELKNSNKKRRSKKKEEKQLPLKLWEIPLEIKVVGFYTDVIKFVKNTEEYQRIIATNGVSVKDYKLDSKKPFPQVEMSIYANVYRAIEQEVKEKPIDPKSKKTKK